MPEATDSLASTAGEAPCAHCGKALAQPLRCSRCKEAVYCCKEHQVNVGREREDKVDA